jgi:nucleotide-binding universal stress UspA family protein
MAGSESPRSADPFRFLGAADFSAEDSLPGVSRTPQQLPPRAGGRGPRRGWFASRLFRPAPAAAQVFDGAGARKGAGEDGGGDVKSRHSKQTAPLDGRDPVLQPEPAHSCDPVFQHGVVVGFDGSLSSERALAYAVGMARRSRCGLVIVHVANRLPATVWAGCEPPVFVDMPDHRTEVLGLELACADFLGGVPWVLVERGGDICHEIEEVGKEYAADAIVVGTTRGLIGRIFGSVSGRLARRANRPVIVIP